MTLHCCLNCEQLETRVLPIYSPTEPDSRCKQYWCNHELHDPDEEDSRLIGPAPYVERDRCPYELVEVR